MCGSEGRGTFFCLFLCVSVRFGEWVSSDWMTQLVYVAIKGEHTSKTPPIRVPAAVAAIAIAATNTATAGAAAAAKARAKAVALAAE